ncbi:NADH-quinone oxidoreductase subunit L [Rubeoparvulum massiliense]|uniref:NADH-quinone oxidoreductase subunit L n=1 Tax=Rubeoparvulum massiliense TaxID=1631346 RepID=UPI00065E10DF|nr:NADH-quinone oxidoreductase subunit L [Rubeoparvulum massiliense]
MIENSWLIPLIPFIAFIILVAFGRQLKEFAAYIGILATMAALTISLFVFWEHFSGGAGNYQYTVEWLAIGSTTITMGFEVTALNSLMALVVSLVSFLVHIYSKGYMQGDERFSVFYSYLALFTFAMLGLVLSPNLLQLYIFWELVGVGSFLLIGFYFYKPEAKAAAKKAFIVTRIGDMGLFIALGLIFWWTGSFDFEQITNAARGVIAEHPMESWQISLIAILIFIAAMGKSGQFPLHTWLPDAMEGPTPVSALIHAATMVAAGVYLVARTFDLFLLSPLALDVVAYVGGFTAIFAATIALVQRDIKRILAYSTISQLGYMMLALGAMGYVASVFHLFTHAFFKALLFLAAGSVIHGLQTQDIFRMGGIWKRMKVTSWAFLIGALALAGIVPFAGFWSKDEILMALYADGRTVLLWVAMITAFLTAFYMFRLFFVAFTGENRSGLAAEESPGSMTFPMIVLAALSLVAGFFNAQPFTSYLGDWLTANGTLYPAHISGPIWIQVVAVVISLAGIGLAWFFYGRHHQRVGVAEGLRPLHQLLFNKYYVDEFYTATVIRPVRGIGYLLQWLDRYVVESLVNLVAYLTQLVARLGVRVQNGQVQVSGAVVILGLVLLLLGLTVAGGYFIW